MKKVILTAFAAALTLSAFAQTPAKVITITGNVKFDDPKFKMEIFRYDGSEKVTVAEFDIDQNGNYNYQMPVEKPGVYTLSCKKWEAVRFWAEDENIKVDFRGMDTAKMKIKNPPFHLIENAGPSNELMNHINFNEYANYQLMIGLSQMAYKAEGLSDDAKQKFAMSLYDLLDKDGKLRRNNLIRTYVGRNSVVSMFSLLKPGTDQELIDLIIAAHPNYAPLNKIVEERRIAAENAKKVEIGNVAPDFAYPTADGKKQLGPKNFRGKYLLIDFWASWCGPCRAEIPHLKEYYELFKGKGVEFLSVSIDSKDADWKKAMEQEQMTWPQVLAPSAGKEITKLYQFSGIPFIILLDKDGKIVAKNIRGNAIKELLEKVTAN